MENEAINVDEYKNYKCVSRNPYGFWDIQNEEGGVVPKKLQGKYTTLVDAHRAIDSYQDHMKATTELSNAMQHKEKVLAKKAQEQEAKVSAEAETPKMTTENTKTDK